jgi:hypothetical protein
MRLKSTLIAECVATTTIWCLELHRSAFHVKIDGKVAAIVEPMATDVFIAKTNTTTLLTILIILVSLNDN